MSSVYHEVQDAGLCGQHCLNALLQGAYFTEIELMEVAHEFDKQEKKLMAEMGTDTTDFLKYMAEDSGNIAEDGNYSVQVLASALKVWNIELIPLTNPEPEAKQAKQNPQGENAFVCNLSSHWFTLRKIDGNWFDLNSLNKEGPRSISDFYLSLYLDTLMQKGYTIFVVKGELPKPNPALAPHTNRGKWHKIGPKQQSSGSGRQPAQKNNDDDDLERAIQASLEEEELKRAIAASMETPDNNSKKNNNNTANNTTTTNNNNSATTTTKPASTPSQPPVLEDPDDDMDDDLRAALELSKQHS